MRFKLLCTLHSILAYAWKVNKYTAQQDRQNLTHSRYARIDFLLTSHTMFDSVGGNAMPRSKHKQTASAFARNDDEIKLQDALPPALQMASSHTPFWVGASCHRVRVTQIQCVCNLCGIAGQANHANKHHTELQLASARVPGSWHKKHCILTGGSWKWNLFVAVAVRYSCSLAFNKRSRALCGCWCKSYGIALIMHLAVNCGHCHCHLNAN